MNKEKAEIFVHSRKYLSTSLPPPTLFLSHSLTKALITLLLALAFMVPEMTVNLLQFFVFSM